MGRKIIYVPFHLGEGEPGAGRYWESKVLRMPGGNPMDPRGGLWMSQGTVWEEQRDPVSGYVGRSQNPSTNLIHRKNSKEFRFIWVISTNIYYLRNEN